AAVRDGVGRDPRERIARELDELEEAEEPRGQDHERDRRALARDAEVAPARHDRGAERERRGTREDDRRAGGMSAARPGAREAEAREQRPRHLALGVHRGRRGSAAGHGRELGSRSARKARSSRRRASRKARSSAVMRRSRGRSVLVRRRKARWAARAASRARKWWWSARYRKTFARIRWTASERGTKPSFRGCERSIDGSSGGRPRRARMRASTSWGRARIASSGTSSTRSRPNRDSHAGRCTE